MSKSIMKGATRRAVQKFAKIKALDDAIEIGGHIGMAARKEKRKMADSWTKRTSTNVRGFFDQAAARAAKRGMA